LTKPLTSAVRSLVCGADLAAAQLGLAVRKRPAAGGFGGLRDHAGGEGQAGQVVRRGRRVLFMVVSGVMNGMSVGVGG
jgi:hypothetical protein